MCRFPSWRPLPGTNRTSVADKPNAWTTADSASEGKAFPPALIQSGSVRTTPSGSSIWFRCPPPAAACANSSIGNWPCSAGKKSEAATETPAFVQKSGSDVSGADRATPHLKTTGSKTFPAPRMLCASAASVLRAVSASAKALSIAS